MQPTPKPRDVYTLVTDRIIESLEKGTVPWQQPWTDAGPPRNLITQRPYRGINLLLLNSLNYTCNEYLTFKQAQHIGGRVKKGEHAHLVVFYIWLEEDENVLPDQVKPKQIPVLRYYFVFNVSQCIGIPERFLPLDEKRNHPLEVCEQIVANMPNRPEIVHHKNEAYYDFAYDYVNMPGIETFVDSENYYAVLFHELIHSTGHQNRLNRYDVDKSMRGSESYSLEELVAEIGACYLASHAGIGLDKLSSVGYIQGWLNRLKNDKRFIVYASNQAQKAADYILNMNQSFAEKDTIEEPFLKTEPT